MHDFFNEGVVSMTVQGKRPRVKGMGEGGRGRGRGRGRGDNV